MEKVICRADSESGKESIGIRDCVDYLFRDNWVEEIERGKYVGSPSSGQARCGIYTLISRASF